MGTRRGGRSSGGGASEVPEQIPSLFAWWRADLEDLTFATGVSAWASKVGGHVLSQGTAAAQPAFAVSAILNGRPYVQFDGTDDTMTCTGAASLWNFLHDGTGCTVLGILNTPTPIAGNNSILSTTNGPEGIWWYISATPTFIPAIYSSAGNIYSTITSYTGDLGYLLDMSFKDADSPEVIIRKNNVNAATGAAGAPTAGAPHHALQLGSLAGSNFGKHNIAEILIYNRVLTSTEKSAIYTYASARYAL